jgi:hypothetical protein
MGLNFKCNSFVETKTYPVKCKIKACFIPQTLQFYKSSTLSLSPW